MASPTVRPCTAALVVLAAGALASCGGGGSRDDGARETPSPTATRAVTLDTDAVEQAIQSSVRKQRGVEARVACPDGVRQAKGADFVCTVKTKEFGTTRFAVTQTDDRGGVRFAAEDG